MSLSGLRPRYEHLGNDLTFYPPVNSRGELNIVNGTRAIVSRLLTLLLTRQGEDSVHPTLGIAPELFEPLSYDEPHYLTTHIRQEIEAWNEAAKIGLTSLEVNINPQDVYTNEIYIYISFTAQGSRGTEDEMDVLTFGYWEWKGATYENLDEFKRSVSLNGQPFFGLS